MNREHVSRIGSEQWSRLKEIFLEAVDQPADARCAFVRGCCAGDAEMEAEVMRLLKEDESAGMFLSSPALGECAPATPKAMPHFDSGALVAGRFRVARFIAAGGMGEVYEAEDLELSERVALKTIRPGIKVSERTLELFKKEIQLSRRVTHPNVCRIFDLFQHRDDQGTVTHLLSMELLAGRTLAQHLAEDGPFAPPAALPLIAHMAEALQAAHDAGVIHRDFKPGNVMLVPAQDGQIRTVITDFGLAISPSQGGDEAAGAPGGTPDYMAPEQAQGGLTCAATDVYSFGLVIAEMVGGRSKNEAGSAPDQAGSADLPLPNGQIAEAGTTCALPRRAESEIRLPAEAAGWQPIVERCLEPDPSRRFSRPMDVAEALRMASRGRSAAPGRKLRVALIAMLSAAAIFAGITWLRLRASVAFEERDWVLVCRFVNATGDRDLDGVLEYALQAQLGNSPYVNVVPPERISDALQMMKKPRDLVIDEAVGREICLREGGIRALIAGRALKLGTRYLLTVEVKDPVRDLTLVGLTQEAADRSQLLTAVSRLARDLRVRLGERLPPRERRGDKLEAVTTNSLRAAREYTQAMAIANGDTGMQKWAQAEQALRQAVEEDPEFAMARIMLAWAMRNQGKPRSEWQAHSEKAFQLAATTGDRERYFIQASYFTMTKADDKAIPLYEKLVSLFPDDYWGVSNLAIALDRGGRLNEAVPFFMRRAALRPNGFDENTAAVIAILRQGEELHRIRPYVQRLRQLPFRTSDTLSASCELYPVFEAWMENDPAKARDGLARFAQGLGTRKPEERNVVLFRIREWYLTLGMLAAAEQIERTLESRNALVPRTEYPWIAYERGDLPGFRRRAQALLTEKPTGMGAIALARAGYVSEAETWAAVMESEKRAPLMLMIVRGECALARGRNPEAIRLLQEALRQMRTGIYAQYYLSSGALADARLREGDITGAIGALEEASRARPLVFYRSGAFWLQVRYRLAQLYRKSGREAAAGRIEEELRRLLACADPDLYILRQLAQASGR